MNNRRRLADLNPGDYEKPEAEGQSQPPQANSEWPSKGDTGWIAIPKKGKMIDKLGEDYAWFEISYEIRYGGEWRFLCYDRYINPVFKWEIASIYTEVEAAAPTREELEAIVSRLPTKGKHKVHYHHGRGGSDGGGGEPTSRDSDGFWNK